MTRDSYQLWAKTFIDGMSHEDWLKANATSFTVGEICAKLNRPKNSVNYKLCQLGLTAKGIAPEAEEAVEGVAIDKFLKAIKDDPKSRRQLSREFDRSEDTIEVIVDRLQGMAYEISRTVSEKIIWSTRATTPVKPPPTMWDEEYGQFIMGKISDLHGGSKWAQFTNLRRCVKEMYDEGVRHISVTGDLTAGNEVYKGQVHEIVTSSGPEQVAILVEYLPRHPGLQYRVIGGNHDFSFIQQNGYNPALQLSKERDDVWYAGFDMADVPITPLADQRLWHPRGGVPYAYSYRLQKGIEQAAFEQLYKVLKQKESGRLLMLDAGHLHISMKFWAGPVLCMQIGCFEGRTSLLRRLGVTPFIGGEIVEFQLTSSQVLRQVRSRDLHFDEIDNDYLDYPVPREESIKLEPWFGWTGSVQASAE